MSVQIADIGVRKGIPRGPDRSQLLSASDKTAQSVALGATKAPVAVLDSRTLFSMPMGWWRITGSHVRRMKLTMSTGMTAQGNHEMFLRGRRHLYAITH